MRPLIVFAALLLSSSAFAQTDVAVRRYALVVGVNSGGASRTPLRYAASDAEAFGQLLSALGGVAFNDRVVLFEPDRRRFDQGVEELKANMLQNSGTARVELVVYFSGHSDEKGLLFGEERMTYPEFRAALETLPADVRIAIVDSCQSGALTRRKGGTMQAPFLLDTSTKVRGQAILTSSSETEAAQESDKIRGSFFTHYLISGLRGAADVTHDRRVTLNEAYQFAFAETLARTEGTQYGAQHPAYEMQLAGTGDVVMTDLRATSSSLTIDDALTGRIFLRNRDGQLVAELFKVAGRSVEIGLEPGRYDVRIEKMGEVLEGAVEVGEHATVSLTPTNLHHGRLEIAARRGDEPEIGAVATMPREKEANVSLSMGVWPTAELMIATDGPGARLTNAYPDNVVVTKALSFDFAYGRTDRLRGIALATGVHRARRSMTGLQIGALASLIDPTGEGNGLQLAGLIGTSGSFSGLQISGLINWNAGTTNGLQAAVLGNRAADGMGLQISGLFNHSGSYNGLQVAGLYNASRDVRGVQLGGLFNRSEKSTGLQAAGIFNRSGDIDGLQLSIINIGGDLRGAQIGIVNIASVVHGVQIGVVNISDEIHGLPIGMFSYAKNSKFVSEIWTSTSDPINLAFRYQGPSPLYAFVTGGFLEMDGGVDFKRSDAYIGLGFGARLPSIGPVSLELDIMVADAAIVSKRSDLLGRQRFNAVWPIANRLSAFAGISYNQYMGWDNYDHQSLQTSFLSTTHQSGDYTLRMWPSLHAGIRI